jgi:hypothetical protein
MSLTMHIIDEAVGLLKKQGYDETGLNNGDRPGYMANQLSIKIRNAIQESLTWNDKSTFEYNTPGYFEGFPDPVLFTMKFEFEISKTSLAITQLVAKYGGHEKVFILNNATALPDSKATAGLLLQQLLSRKHKGSSRTIEEGKKGLGL